MGRGPGRVFGTMLKAFRAQAGLSSDQVGSRVHLSGSQIRKVEDGSRTPARDLVEAIEAIPEMPCNGALMQLYEILEKRLGQGGAYPGWFAEWLAKEALAVRLKSFELAVVPGLLQTEEYARALLTDRIGFNGDVDEAVTTRMSRQRILERGEPPELFVVLDEAVLHRPVGGADVMAAQLKHLTESPGRTIVRVIPAGTGVHDGLQGAFTVAEFADASSAAYLETGLRGIVVESGDDVTELTATWDRLAAEALPRSPSLKLIEEVAQEWNRS